MLFWRQPLECMRLRAVLFATLPSPALPSAPYGHSSFLRFSKGTRNNPASSRHLAAGMERLIPIPTRFIAEAIAEDGPGTH